MLGEAWCQRGRLAHHQSRLNRNLGRILFLSLNTLKQGLGGDFAHPAEWLADGGQARIVKGSAGDVVESHDRYV